MAKVSRAQADLNRSRIEDSSARLFRERGLQGVSVATYSTNMQSIITSLLGSGCDVLLMTPPPSNPGAYGLAPSLAVQQTYVDAFKALALSNNLPIVDIFGRWVSYAQRNPNGYYYDEVHPVSVGYIDMARALNNLLSL